MKECRLSLDRLTLDPINRFENVNEIVNIMENLFDTIKKPKRLKNIDLLLVCVLKQYTNVVYCIYNKMLNEKIYIIGQQIYPKV